MEYKNLTAFRGAVLLFVQINHDRGRRAVDRLGQVGGCQIGVFLGDRIFRGGRAAIFLLRRTEKKDLEISIRKFHREITFGIEWTAIGVLVGSEYNFADRQRIPLGSYRSPNTIRRYPAGAAT